MLNTSSTQPTMNTKAVSRPESFIFCAVIHHMVPVLVLESRHDAQTGLSNFCRDNAMTAAACHGTQNN